MISLPKEAGVYLAVDSSYITDSPGHQSFIPFDSGFAYLIKITGQSPYLTVDAVINANNFDAHSFGIKNAALFVAGSRNPVWFVRKMEW